MFRWAVSEELVSLGVHQALKAVTGLRKGYGKIREAEPVRPVADKDVDATLPHLTAPVRAMVELGRLTGAPPGELCAMTTGNIDRSDPSWWTYKPQSHKNDHHNKGR